MIIITTTTTTKKKPPLAFFKMLVPFRNLKEDQNTLTQTAA